MAKRWRRMQIGLLALGLVAILLLFQACDRTPLATQSPKRSAVQTQPDDRMAQAYETDPAVLEPLEMPLLGIFAENDQAIPIDQVRTFETVLKSLNKAANIYIYEGVGHAFANPSGQNYNAEAAEDAWDKTLRFLADALAP